MDFKRLTKSNNPMLSDRAIDKAATATKQTQTGPIIRSDGAMTVSGAVNKTILLVIVLLATTIISYL